MRAALYFFLSLMAQEVRYKLSWGNLLPAHTYQIEAVFPKTEHSPVEVRLPAWRPGRYILQNFASAVWDFGAYDLKGNPLPWKKTEKDVWQVMTSQAFVVRYKFYAGVLDAGSSYVDANVAYFNGSNLFMYVTELIEKPCLLEIAIPQGWKIATALPSQKDVFRASSYHSLIDCPTVISPSLQSFSTQVEGCTLYAHFYGKVTFDPKALIDALAKIARVQKKIWGDLPLSVYHHLYFLVPFRIVHAVEHENCAMYMMDERAGLERFISISAHEFFHLWNVKRLRPRALMPYRYDREVYTSLHWFTEGVTDYYTGLTLVRAGLISQESYLEGLAKSLTDIENSYAYKVFSPSEMSVNSWLVTSAYQVPFLQASFYASGKRVGFALDLFLRGSTQGKVSLDDVLRVLYHRYRETGIPETGIEEVVTELVGPSAKTFFSQHVYGSQPIPYARYAQGSGIRVEVRKKNLSAWAALGIEGNYVPQGYKVIKLRAGGAAFEAGVEEGDILTQLGSHVVDEKIEEILPGLEGVLSVKVIRDQEVHTFPMRFFPYKEVEFGIFVEDSDWLR
ncbi:MAG: M61 family metallopeptidase [Bacteroidia bacterium]